MLKNLKAIDGAKVLNKPEQSEVRGGFGPKPSPCCDPALACCAPNPAYNGTNCRFVAGPPCV